MDLELEIAQASELSPVWNWVKKMLQGNPRVQRQQDSLSTSISASCEKANIGSCHIEISSSSKTGRRNDSSFKSI